MSADGIHGAAVVRQVVSDVAAILWRFSIRYQTDFRKHYSAEMYHGSSDLPWSLSNMQPDVKAVKHQH